MTKPVFTEAEADLELTDAAWWYEERRSGLGRRFVDAFAATLERVARFPAAGSFVPHVAAELRVRRAPIGRFPYHAIYLETPDAIHILAVAHDRRKPGYWLSRPSASLHSS